MYSAGDDSVLAELAELYAVNEVSGVDWMRRLPLSRPRRSLRCLSWHERAAKRTIDVLGSLVLMVLSLPVVAAAIALIKLTSPGPVFYSQIRTGLNRRQRPRDRRRRNLGPPPGLSERRQGDRRRGQNYGQPFRIYKLRTMALNAEAGGPQLAIENDPRISRVGRFLRRSRIDELPQLWNVLKGEMSLVGPRPERPEFIQELSADVPGYLDRLGLKPGLTGLAQVTNGYDVDRDAVRRKVRLDIYYLQNCSLLNDFRILLRTVGVVLTGRGAR